MNNTIKKCNVCDDLKKISEFNMDKNQKDGHCGICKICRSKYRQTHLPSIIPSSKPTKCIHCHLTKKPSEFYHSKYSKNGLQSICKACSLIKKRKCADRTKNKKKTIPEYKRCSKCKKTKKQSHFFRVSSNPDGLNYLCKECMNSVKKPNIDYNVLYDLYINQKLSAEKIGPMYSVSSQTIRIYLRTYNIETRKDKNGKNNGRWIGGVSFAPYCIKFNNKFKESIRNKFNRTCFLCGITENEQIKKQIKKQKNNGKRTYKLAVHHVNYNKDCLCDDIKCEFVPLCINCHGKTNANNRQYYEKLIMDKLSKHIF